MLIRLNVRIVLTLLLCLTFGLHSLDAQSDNDYGDDGQNAGDVISVGDPGQCTGNCQCPTCPALPPGENPQGLFGKPSLMQTLSGVRVNGFENSFGHRLTNLVFGPVSTPQPVVTRVIRQTGQRNRGRGRGRVRVRQRGRVRAGGRRRPPLRGRPGFRRGRGGRRGRFRGDYQ